MHRYSWYILLLLQLLLVACQPSSPVDERRASPVAGTVILRMGAESIDAQDWAARTAILQLDSIPQAEAVALYQLTQMLVLKALAQERGVALQQKHLDAETRRIDQATLRPERIAEIKQICAGDTALYQKVFVQEDLLPRWLPLHYAWDAAIHRPSAEKAMDVFTEVLLQPELFEQDSSTQVFLLTATELKPLEQEAPKEKQSNFIDQSQQENPELRALVDKTLESKQDARLEQLHEALDGLKAGQIHPRPLEWEREYWIVQLLKKQGEEKQFRVRSIAKENYFQWLEEQTQGLEIKVYDRSSWEAMLASVPKAKDLFAGAVFPIKKQK